MMRTGLLLRSLVLNILFSLVATIGCMGLLYLCSLVFNSYAHAEGLAFAWRTKWSVTPDALERYYHARNMFLLIGAALGLASSQVVWYSHTRPSA
jgi:hypothetical protein